MRMISPQVVAPQITIAEEQAEFKPITAAIVNSGAHGNRACVCDGETVEVPNSILLAFRPSDDERARLACGDDIYISLLTFGGPMQGILVLAGKEDAAAAFGLRVDDR